MSAQSKLLRLRAPDGPVPPRVPPFPTLRKALAILVVLGIIPFWIVRYFVRRPPYADSLFSFLFMRAAKSFTVLDPSLPLPESEGEAARDPAIGQSLTSGPWKEVTRTLVSVPPVGPEWRTAYAADVPGVTAVERPGFIMSPPGSLGQGADLAKEGEKIVLYFHGGGYIVGHPLGTHFPPNIALNTNTRVFGVQYRKCADDASAFPAPLLDALAAWKYLTVTLRFAPTNVIVSGDSAGGHLSLAFVQQLNAMGQPLPGGLAIVSPWCDMTMSFPSWQRNSEDTLCEPLLDMAVKSALRHYDVAVVRDPFFSPALAEPGYWRFLAGVPVFASFGTLEAFADEVEVLAKAMDADGVDFRLFRDVDGLHDTPNVPFSKPSRLAGILGGIEGVLKQIDLKAGGNGVN